jgi:hypothetical protein
MNSAEKPWMDAEEALVALYRDLEEHPGPPAALFALATWYQGQGSASAAECLRWTAEQNRYPFRYRKEGGQVLVSCDKWHDGWYWWAVDQRGYGSDWGFPAECRLPPLLWNLLRHSLAYQPAVFKEYPTLRSAYEALFAAWVSRQTIEETWAGGKRGGATARRDRTEAIERGRPDLTLALPPEKGSGIARAEPAAPAVILEPEGTSPGWVERLFPPEPGAPEAIPDPAWAPWLRRFLVTLAWILLAAGLYCLSRIRE